MLSQEEEQRLRSRDSQLGFASLISVTPEYPDIIIAREELTLGRARVWFCICVCVCVCVSLSLSLSLSLCISLKLHGLGGCIQRSCFVPSLPCTQASTICVRHHKISSVHCKLFRTPNPAAENLSASASSASDVPAYQWHVLDLSSNGTFVNGVVLGKNNQTRIEHQCQISLLRGWLCVCVVCCVLCE
jgi:FHA domain